MNITSPNWWLQMIISTFVTMVFIYIIKKANAKLNIPVVNSIVTGA